MDFEFCKWLVEGPDSGNQVENGIQPQGVHQAEELMHHDALAAVLKIRERRARQAKLRGNLALSQAETPTAGSHRAAKASIELHL